MFKEKSFVNFVIFLQNCKTFHYLQKSLQIVVKEKTKRVNYVTMSNGCFWIRHTPIEKKSIYNIISMNFVINLTAVILESNSST
jgi:hypothetical protein